MKARKIIAATLATAVAAVSFSAAVSASTPLPISEGKFLDDGRYVASQTVGNGSVKVNLQAGCTNHDDSVYVGSYVKVLRHTNRAWTGTLTSTHAGFKTQDAVTDKLKKDRHDYVSLNSGKTNRPEGVVTVSLTKPGVAGFEPIEVEFERPRVMCNQGGAIDPAN